MLLLTKMRTTKSLLERSSDLLSFDCLSLVVARANFFCWKKSRRRCRKRSRGQKSYLFMLLPMAENVVRKMARIIIKIQLRN